MDNSLVLVVVGLVCFLLYKLIEQNNKLEKFKMKVKSELKNNASASRSETRSSRSSKTSDADTDESDSDSDLKEFIAMTKETAESSGTPSRQWSSKKKGRKITFIQNNVGPHNNDNLNLHFGVHFHPAGGGLGFMGDMLTSGLGKYLNQPTKPGALPAGDSTK